MKRLCLLVGFMFLTVPATLAQDVGQFFDSNGVQIHYTDQGQGEPVVLVHGFSVDLSMWTAAGVTKRLTESGYRTIAMDMRGHGRSDKPHEADRYGLEMVRDVVRLLDHLRLDRAHVVGYSMGAAVANQLRATNPGRLATTTVAGAGWWGKGEGGALFDFEEVANGAAAGRLGPLIRSLTPSGEPQPTEEEIAARSQAFADRNDEVALAGAMRSFASVAALTADELSANTVPTLALVGDRDPLIRDVKAGLSEFPNDSWLMQ